MNLIIVFLDQIIADKRKYRAIYRGCLYFIDIIKVKAILAFDINVAKKAENVAT